MDIDNSFSLEDLSDCSSLFEFLNSSLSLPSTPSPQRTKPRQTHGKLSVKWPNCRDDVLGALNLQFFINIGTSQSVCNFSKKLKKIYISMNQVLRIKFNWTSWTTYPCEPLYLRTALLYTEDYNKPIPIQRCYAHMSSDLPQNIGVGQEQLRHVFQVTDPAKVLESSYEIDANGILTTRTPLRTEDGEAWIDYLFFCQNSCLGGKCPTKLVFTFENSMGHVVAKRSAMIQVCSNPKRDKERDESRITMSSRVRKSKIKKQAAQQQIKPLPPLPPSNNFEINCNADEAVYDLSIDVIGEDNYKAVLKYAYDIMATQAIRTGNYHIMKPHMDAVLSKERNVQ